MKEIKNGKKVYEASEGSPIHKKDHVQAVGEFIDGLKVPRTPENILNEVKSHPKHIINHYIEWDDKKAGHRWRIDQIRNIVNHIVVNFVEVGDRSVKIRAFHSVKVSDDSPLEYVPVKVAFSNEYMRMQIVEKAYNELVYWKDRYSVYNEFQPVVKAISEFVQKKQEILEFPKSKKQALKRMVSASV